jgi:hypothetical protein
MLSYPIPEAEELLTNKLSAAQQSLSNCEEDMDFLREQVTVRTSCPFSPDSQLNTPSTFLPPLFSLSISFEWYGDTDNPFLTPDDGSRHSSRLQLGHRTKAQGGGGGGLKVKSDESVVNPISGSWHKAMIKMR